MNPQVLPHMNSWSFTRVTMLTLAKENIQTFLGLFGLGFKLTLVSSHLSGSQAQMKMYRIRNKLSHENLPVRSLAKGSLYD